MKKTNVLCLVLLTVLFLFSESALLGQVTAPDKFFGFTPGDDKQLLTYEELISYLKKLESESPMIKLAPIGESTLGKPMYIAFISDKDNISNLNELKTINRELAKNPKLSEQRRAELIKKGRVFFTATLSMHSTEVGPSQAAPLIVYKLLTTNDPDIKQYLKNVVYMMVPCHNPDGMDMVVAHYKKYKNTKYDGCSMPGLYHKYVGHDDNRDFVTLSQKESQAISHIFSTEWFPQVMVEKHQMGSTGARYFVPPNHDPIAENIDAGLWNWMEIFGANMIKDMTAAGLAGVSYNYIFDNYWPGSTETCLWKNVISFLTEAASAHLASPIYIEPNELGVGGKGLSEYKKSVNFPMPWKGGWWRLSDIISYEITSTLSILKTASIHKQAILKFKNDICKSEVKKGETQAPFYYVFPAKQHDKSELVNLVNLLMEHGVNVYTASEKIYLNGIFVSKGDVVVPLAQPFRAFIKEVLESQTFPVRHYTPGGEMIHPYDITSWSLPLHFGVKSYEVDEFSDKLNSSLIKIKNGFNYLRDSNVNNYAIFSSTNNESYKAVFTAIEKGIKVRRLLKDIDGYKSGSFVIKKSSISSSLWQKLLGELSVSPDYSDKIDDKDMQDVVLPKIGLVETFFHDMDAGWTRFIFDTYHIPYKVLHPGDFEKTDLSKYDLILFPNTGKSTLMKGKSQWGGRMYMSTYPPAYVKGMEKKGFEKLLLFLDNGGIISAWGRSTELFTDLLSFKKNGKTEEFQLPIRNVADRAKKKGLDCPGSLIQVDLLKDHQLTLGMPEKVGVFYRGSPLFRTSVPVFDMDRRVIGRFGKKDILLSGYCEKEDVLYGQPIMVWLKKGKGQLVLFGFSPQFRASTHSTFKLLFNTILLPKIK